jgi:hypothetical protein
MAAAFLEASGRERNPARVATTALSRYSLFLLSLQTTECRVEQYSGEEPILRTHGEKTTALSDESRSIA